jgi:diacylglycerol kinase family enzyme
VKSKARTAIILNPDAGGAKSADITTIRTQIEEQFSAVGHVPIIELGKGARIGKLIDQHIRAGDVDNIVVGGGDGTVSLSARQLVGREMALGVLPLGTMNLYARSLGMPTDIGQAIHALATARPQLVDVGRAGSHVFLHHVSFGLHPLLVKLREKMNYSSRVGKMFANLRALIGTLRRPHILVFDTQIDGKTKVFRTPALAVSNNLLRGNHLPYADELTEGVLGIYVCTSTRRADIARLATSIALGEWTSSPFVAKHQARELRIDRVRGVHEPLTASIDGELVTFDGPINLNILSRSLKIMMPPKLKSTDYSESRSD